MVLVGYLLSKTSERHPWHTKVGKGILLSQCTLSMYPVKQLSCKTAFQGSTVSFQRDSSLRNAVNSGYLEVEANLKVNFLVPENLL